MPSTEFYIIANLEIFMKKLINTLLVSALLTFIFNACNKDDTATIDSQNLPIPEKVLTQIKQLGFSTDNVLRAAEDNGYIVEGDIFLSEEDLSRTDLHQYSLRFADVEQYHTTNLVTGLPRVIRMYAPEGGKNGYSPGMIAGLDLAIDRYNAQNLQITFQRVTNSAQADIVMTRLSKGDERRGVLGSSGFPTSSGDPYSQIKMSGILESSYNLSTAGIATIIAHEMGHCIGFRHTDYYNRSISCGGAPTNEGDGGIGAILIPGTPSTATLSAKSWMLSCTDGGDRPFNNDDRTALNYLY